MLSVAAWIPIGLAWRPFLEPLPLHAHWMWLLLPLAVAIALVYKTLKLPTLDGLMGETAKLTALIVVAMIAAAALLWLLTELV